MADNGQSLALFVDFENLALGFAGTRKRFEIDKVLDRLVTKGKILVKKAYADWTRFGDYRRELHESSIELIEIPKRSQVGKNSADIRLVVDALDLCYSKAHLDTFCILSGDSDFSPLVSKLRENGKHVIGVGMKASTSNLLVEGCDEFIYYEDIERQDAVQAAQPAVQQSSPLDKKAEALQVLMDTVQALKRDGREVLWGSLVKDTIRRRKPQFNESYHGYRSWSELLEDAQRRGLLSLQIDNKSGTYVIVSFTANPGAIATVPPPTTVNPGPAPVREFPRRENGGGRHGWSRDHASRDVASRDAAAKDSAARDAAAREAAAKDLATREAAIQSAPVVPLPDAPIVPGPNADRITEMFLSMPVVETPGAPVETSERETSLMKPEEIEAATAEAEKLSKKEAEAAAPADAEGEAGAVKKGVRSRGRRAVKKPAAGPKSTRTRRRDSGA